MPRYLAAALAAALALNALPVAAREQMADAGQEATEGLDDESEQEGPPAVIEIDPSMLAMPAIAFEPTPEIEAGYDKYFYFHRDGISFEEAYADIKECDALASGMSYYADASSAIASATAQYGVLAGGIGGAIGSAIADAITGSAMRREMRRINLRNCMGFKEYKRYGLSRDLWKAFNFEEGMGRKREAVRERALQLQALVATGPVPRTQELGL